MTARRRHHRSAFTIVEMLVVIAVIVILGAILVPSLVGFWSNNRTKAGVDITTARLSDARAAAISRGQAYRVCVSPDGRQVRVCPDESELVEQTSSGAGSTPLVRTDTLPDTVVLTPMLTSTADGTSAPAAAEDGWVTLVTFLPDGTCRETSSEFQLAEPDVTPQVVRVRGMTGVWTVNPSTATNPMSGGRP
jgi:prepilin-type N-terminal cleavage/methylation domain-containing protein